MVDIVSVPVQKGPMKIQITGGVVEIDECDAEKVNEYSWYVNEHGYAIARIHNKLTRMHRYILEAPHGSHVDHANRKGLDNRRCNLRVGTQNHNMWNSIKKNRGGLKTTTSKYKGVHLDRKSGKWMASVWKFSKKIFYAKFLSEIEAAVAYNIVARKEFGEYCLPNNVRASASTHSRVQAIVDATPKPKKKRKWGSVCFNSKWKKWIAHRNFNGRKYLGGFDTKREAEEALEISLLISK